MLLRTSGGPYVRLLSSVFVQIHLGLMEGRVTHVVWPPSQARRVANRRQAHRLVKVDSKGT